MFSGRGDGNDEVLVDHRIQMLYGPSITGVLLVHFEGIDLCNIVADIVACPNSISHTGSQQSCRELSKREVTSLASL